MNIQNLFGGNFNSWTVVAMSLIVFIFFLLILQHKMIYFPRSYGSEAPVLKGIEKLSYNTKQGHQVAFYLPARQGTNDKLPENIWVIFGGNASLALDWYGFVSNYPDLRTTFLLIDYPGYGLSEGRASPQSISESALTALDTLSQHLQVERRILSERLSLVGHSLGAAVALQLATKIPPQRLVLISPFTNIRDMAIRVVGWPLNYLVLHNFDNQDRLTELLKLDSPPHITILHGDQDEIIPVVMGRKLAKISPVIDYFEVKGGDHNGILTTSETDIFQAMLGKL